MKKIRRNIIFAVVAVAVVAAVAASVILILPPSASRIFNDSLQSIVELKAYFDSVGESFGTAEFIDGDGTLVTNAHVVTYSKRGETFAFDSYSVRFASEDKYREVELLRYDSEKDIALLKLKDNSAPHKAIEAADSDSLSFGDKVYAIGNASNYGLSITQGIIGIPKVIIEYDGRTREAIQCDLTISSGNSGGALLDERGRLIGITTFRTKDGAGNVIYGLAYCIPVNTVKAYVSTI